MESLEVGKTYSFEFVPGLRRRPGKFITVTQLLPPNGMRLAYGVAGQIKDESGNLIPPERGILTDTMATNFVPVETTSTTGRTTGSTARRAGRRRKTRGGRKKTRR